MSTWLLSFSAGFLTVLAPCSLFLLPTVLVGSSSGKNPFRPWIVVVSLGFSVFLFSLLVKGTSLAFTIPNSVWTWISGLLLGFFGFTLLFPHIWDQLVQKLSLGFGQKWLHHGSQKEGPWGAVLMGASLGPVFSTCSPTFAVLLAVILPTNFLLGTINIGLFVLGMMIPFLLIAVGGQKIVQKFRFAANPHGWFRKSLGLILLLVAFTVITGNQKTIEKTVLEKGYLGPIELEKDLEEKLK